MQEGIAKPSYEKVIDMGASSPERNKKELLEAFEYLGNYYWRRQDYQNAKFNFQEALKVDPDNWKIKETLQKLKK